MQHTFDDILAATQTILGEARAEPWIGQVAVAYVLLNRLQRPQYFKCQSIFEVCHKPLQFSMWNNSEDKNLEIVMAIPMSDKRFLTAMAAFLVAASLQLPDPTYGADHYHTIEKPGYAKTWPPVWAEEIKKTIDINAHRFYRLAKG